MAAGDVAGMDVAAMVAAGDAAESRVRDLEVQLKQLHDGKLAKAKELKKEKAKRDRLMDKAGKNLSIEELALVLAAKTAKAKAKAAAKAKAKAKAVAKAAAAPPPLPAAGVDE